MRWLDAIFDRAAERNLRAERSLVEVGPEASRRLFRRDMTRLVVGAAALVGVVFLPDDWQPLCMPVLGWVLGRQGIMLLQRATAYRSGWLDGRMRFVRMANQHHEAGNTPTDWIETEWAHDAVNVLGAQPVIDDDEPRDDD